MQDKKRKIPPAIPMARLPIKPLMKTVTIFEEDDPHSLINLLPEFLRPALRNANKQVIFQGETAHRSQYALQTEHIRLRIVFWDEYARAIEEDRQMTMNGICGGVCSKDFFMEVILPDRWLFSYVCSPPTQYDAALRTMHSIGMDRLQDILSLPLHNQKGEVNTSVVNSIIKVVDMLDKRVKGEVLQKIAVHKHITHGTSEGVVVDHNAEPTAEGELRSLTNQIAMIKNKLSVLDPVPLTPEPEGSDE